MTQLGKDLSHALRSIRAAPGLATAVVVVSGISLAAVIAVASLVQAFLLRDLPYPDADRLVWLQSVSDGNVLGVSHPDYLDWKEQIEPLHGLAKLDARNHMVLSLGSEAESVLATRTTSDLFPLLGVEPLLGRVFPAEADRPGAGDVVILSHDLWARRFAEDPEVLGRRVQLDGAPYVVIGVMPPEFRFPVRSDVWVPSSAWADQWAHRSIRVDTVVGRLSPAASLDSAQQAARAAAEQLAREHPQSNAGISVRVTPLREVWSGESRSALLLLLGTCGLLLLIAAANTTNLLLVWAARRSREMAVRTALGATPGRLLRQRVLESSILSLLSGVLALPLAAAGLRWAEAMLPAELPTWIRLELDPVLTMAALLLALTYGIVLGTGAGFGLGRRAVTGILAPAARGPAGASVGVLRRSLAVVQVALALVLLVGAGLMGKSLLALQDTDPGFEAGDVLVVEIDLPVFGIESYQQVNDLYRRLIEETASVAGVETAAMTTSLPLGGQETWHLWELTLEDQGAKDQQSNPRVHGQGISEGYFEAMDVPLLEGRAFEARDAGNAAPGVILGRRLAEELWPDRPALGRRLKLGPHAAPSPWLTVVGVVGDVRYDSLARGDQMDLYVPLGRLPSWPIHLLAEVQSRPAAFAASLRQTVWDVSPDLGMRGVQPLEQHVATSLWRQRTWTRLLVLFAGLALILALSGVFAVMSQMVEARRGEIAVRIALGAGRRDVVGRVLAEVSRLSVPGIVLGAVASLLLGRLLQSLLFQVVPGDPSVLLGAALLLFAATLAACWLPIRRALAVDPQTQLQAG